MEKERKVKKLALIAVIVAVLGMTIAFAALSQTLTISGTANTEASYWDIFFDDVSRPILIGTAKADYPYDLTTGKNKDKQQKTAIVSEDRYEISDIRATLKKPGDEVRYTTKIINAGTIAAEIASIEMPSLTAGQKEIFDFSVIYTADGKEVSVGDVIPGYPNMESETCSGCEQDITIKVRYKDITDESLLPEEGQSIDFSYKINYVQSDKNALAHVGNQIFGIELSNGQTPVTEGNATATNPTLIGNTINGYTVTVSDKGDKAVYKFDITNIADHAITVSTDKLLYSKEILACVNGTQTENCEKFDFSNEGMIDIGDLTPFNTVKTEFKGADGSNKIPANSTKTFMITAEMPSDFGGNLTGDAITILTGDININYN